MSSAVRIALVGAGDIGRTAHLPALLDRADVKLVAIVDPDAAARDRAGELLAARGADPVAMVDDVAALAAVEPVDAWVVATPPWVGPRLVRGALEAGRCVLAEKPLATSFDKAREAFGGLTPEASARLQVGFAYRHDPAIEHLRELIVGGALGSPLHVRATVYDEVDDPRDREHGDRIRATLAHGLPILHDGAHLADWLRYLLGADELTVDHAWSLRTDRRLPADNLCGATLHHPGGHVIQLEVGWLLPAAVPSVVTVRGAGGCAELDVMTLDLRLDDGRVTVDRRAAQDRTTRCFARQLERFVALVRGDRERRAGAAGAPTLADGLASLALTERIVARIEAAR